MWRRRALARQPGARVDHRYGLDNLKNTGGFVGLMVTMYGLVVPLPVAPRLLPMPLRFVCACTLKPGKLALAHESVSWVPFLE